MTEVQHPFDTRLNSDCCSSCNK